MTTTRPRTRSKNTPLPHPQQKKAPAAKKKKRLRTRSKRKHAPPHPQQKTRAPHPQQESTRNKNKTFLITPFRVCRVWGLECNSGLRHWGLGSCAGRVTGTASATAVGAEGAKEANRICLASWVARSVLSAPNRSLGFRVYGF